MNTQDNRQSHPEPTDMRLDRRRFIKKAGIATGALLTLPGCSQALRSSTTHERRPNIIIILADDLGYGDISAYNPKSRISTPAVDRLANEGIRFQPDQLALGVEIHAAAPGGPFGPSLEEQVCRHSGICQRSPGPAGLVVQGDRRPEARRPVDGEVTDVRKLAGEFIESRRASLAMIHPELPAGETEQIRDCIASL
jgi:hypothetical protein